MTDPVDWTYPVGVAPGNEVPAEQFGALPQSWQNTETKFVLIGVDGSHWNLSGNYAGREGLTMSPHAAGLMHTPFVSLFAEGPYQIGANYERTDYKKRIINIGVMINVDYGPATSWRYRMLEQAFWRALHPSDEATLCCFTRTHGWRFLKVRLAEEPKTNFELDPTAFDNNFMQWDVSLVATQPYWYKMSQTVGWQNNGTAETTWEAIEDMMKNMINRFLGDVLIGNGGMLVPGIDIGSGTLKVWNNGDIPAWPKFLVSSPGRAWIQDGVGGKMVPLPLLTAKDGTCLVDTDPTARTLTCATDPVDPLLYKIMRNSQLLDVILHDTLISTEPVWKRFPYRFTTPTPARTQASLKVYHSDGMGAVQVLMPQKYDKCYG